MDPMRRRHDAREVGGGLGVAALGAGLADGSARAGRVGRRGHLGRYRGPHHGVLGVAMWVAFKATLKGATTNVNHQVSNIGK
jgi:hypothetical protein